jgi:hypothetical protein
MRLPHFPTASGQACGHEIARLAGVRLTHARDHSRIAAQVNHREAS